MNIIELRYRIYAFLNGIAQPAAIQTITLDSPSPGDPVSLSVVTEDPYTTPPSIRTYRITIEEIS